MAAPNTKHKTVQLDSSLTIIMPRPQQGTAATQLGRHGELKSQCNQLTGTKPLDSGKIRLEVFVLGLLTLESGDAPNGRR